MREGFGVGHSVTFEVRREGEHVRFRIELFELLLRDRAKGGYPISEPVPRDSIIKLQSCIAVARAVADDRQPPRQIRERRQRCDQNIEPLAGDHCADREQSHHSILTASHRPRWIAAWRCDCNAFGRDPVIGTK